MMAIKRPTLFSNCLTNFDYLFCGWRNVTGLTLYGKSALVLSFYTENSQNLTLWNERLCSEVAIASEPTSEHSGIESSTPECSGLVACPW